MTDRSLRASSDLDALRFDDRGLLPIVALVARPTRYAWLPVDWKPSANPAIRIRQARTGATGVRKARAAMGSPVNPSHSTRRGPSVSASAPPSGALRAAVSRRAPVRAAMASGGQASSRSR